MTSERQNRLRQRKKEQGLVRVEVYVPEERADELREIAQAMCDEARASANPLPDNPS